ncbi:EVA1C protein, partial [Heliornis fulica]|nr:EVA1C protein [Heliornis fulica]
LAGYISQVLKNYTDHACDGEYVSLRCPHRTTISIQSSFYGRIVPSHQMCPSRYPHSYATLIKEDVACSVGTSLQKMLDECQDRRSCQFLVNSRLFGADPCPGTGKYLIVWYKCRPNEYKSKVACEDDKLRLSCKKSMVIAIFSAIFGRTQGDGLECPYQTLGMPMIECQSATALQLMIKRCHGKRSCSIYASTHEFGDPCYPGIRKHLNVIYTCGRSATFYPLDNTPFLLPVDETGPPALNSSMEPVGVSTEMALLSNILAAYAFIT